MDAWILIPQFKYSELKCILCLVATFSIYSFKPCAGPAAGSRFLIATVLTLSLDKTGGLQINIANLICRLYAHRFSFLLKLSVTIPKHFNVLHQVLFYKRWNNDSGSRSVN